jgi:hypothetical protein
VVTGRLPVDRLAVPVQHEPVVSLRRGAAPDPRNLWAVSSSGGELERAVRLHQSVSATCAELQRECFRIRRVCVEQLRENAAIIERIRMMRAPGSDAEPPPDP